MGGYWFGCEAETKGMQDIEKQNQYAAFPPYHVFYREVSCGNIGPSLAFFPLSANVLFTSVAGHGSRPAVPCRDHLVETLPRRKA